MAHGKAPTGLLAFLAITAIFGSALAGDSLASKLSAKALAEALVDLNAFSLITTSGKEPKYEGRKSSEGIVKWWSNEFGVYEFFKPDHKSVAFSTGTAKFASTTWGDDGATPRPTRRLLAESAANLPELPGSKNGLALTFRVKAKRDGYLQAPFQFYTDHNNPFGSCSGCEPNPEDATFLFLVDGKNKALLSNGRTMSTKNMWTDDLSVDPDSRKENAEMVFDEASTQPLPTYAKVQKIRSVRVNKDQVVKIRIVIADNQYVSGVSAVYLRVYGIKLSKNA